MGERVWFGAGSHREAAALAGVIVALLPDGAVLPDMEVRGDGVRVRAADLIPDAAELVAETGAVQELSFRIDSVAAVEPFWRAALNYGGAGSIQDRLRRCPAVRFERSGEARPLRNRIHLDSGHPGPVAATAAALQVEGGRELFTCEWYSTVADADGNEVDIVPGGPLEGTKDWTAMFGGMAFYPGTTPRQAVELATEAGRLADVAGIPLMIDLRPEGVVFDSGKDQWEQVAGFADLAAAIEGVARAAGLTADNRELRFVQAVIDVVDLQAVSAFWCTVLGYVPAPNTDLFDPRQLNPVVTFQNLDPTELDRRRQRNRIHFELLLAADQVRPRIDAALAAGGTVLDGTRLADPEGNEITLTPSTVPQP